MELRVLCITILLIQCCHSKDVYDRGDDYSPNIAYGPYNSQYNGGYGNGRYGNRGLNNGGYNNKGYNDARYNIGFNDGENKYEDSKKGVYNNNGGPGKGIHGNGEYGNGRYGNGGYGNGGYGNGRYGNGGYGNGKYGNGEYNNGNFNKGGYNNGGYKNGGYKNGGYNYGGYNNGGYYNGGYNNGGFSNGGLVIGYGSDDNNNRINGVNIGGVTSVLNSSGVIIGDVTSTLTNALTNIGGVTSVLNNTGVNTGAVTSVLNNTGVNSGAVTSILNNTGVNTGDVTSVLNNTGVNIGNVTSIINNSGINTVLGGLQSGLNTGGLNTVLGGLQSGLNTGGLNTVLGGLQSGLNTGGLNTVLGGLQSGLNTGGLNIGFLPSLPIPNLPVPLPINYTERIERPCRTFDISCIRRYFRKHSYCKEVHGPVPEPYYREQSSMYLPRVNITINALDVEYFGLNGRIEEFYINRDTDNLVMAVEFRGLAYTSHKALLRYHRPEREPIITEGYLNATHDSLVVTIIIPNIYHLNLAKSEAFSYVNEPFLRFALGAGIVQYADPVYQAALLDFLADIPTNIKEVHLTEGPFYIATFIQCNICDFGLKIV